MDFFETVPKNGSFAELAVLCEAPLRPFSFLFASSAAYAAEFCHFNFSRNKIADS